MKIGEAPVSSESKIIGHAKYPIADTLQEAIDHPDYGVGEQKLLDLYNAQVKTNAMNTLRTNLTKGPTKSILRAEAINEIVQEIANGEHPDCIGNKEVLDALITRRMTQIEERMTQDQDAVSVDTSDEE